MSDDNDFTAPCTEYQNGVRCLLETTFVNGEPQPHAHAFPNVVTREQIDVTESYGVIVSRVPVGSGHELLVMRDGAIRFAHDCDRHIRFPQGTLTLRIAPALQFGPHKILDGTGHIVTIIAKHGGGSVIDVEPSILCEDCGTHGFVRNGKWADA